MAVVNPGAFVPPTLLAAPPQPQEDPLVAGLTSFLSSSQPWLKAAGDVYSTLESKKQAEAAAKREQELALARAKASAGATGRAWLAPTVAIGGAAALLLVIVLARR